jgi:hypothetical protein
MVSQNSNQVGGEDEQASQPNYRLKPTVRIEMALPHVIVRDWGLHVLSLAWLTNPVPVETGQFVKTDLIWIYWTIGFLEKKNIFMYYNKTVFCRFL